MRMRQMRRLYDVFQVSRFQKIEAISSQNIDGTP
jgi:hypothetical protein